jgi:hypothetical protein
VRRVPTISMTVWLIALVLVPTTAGASESAHKDLSVASVGRVPSAIDCTASTEAGATNTQLDCDTKAPNNEPHIVVDPTDPLHMIASSNDYDSCCDEFYTTFDGGLTWQTGNMSVLTKRRTGSDPVTVFEPKSGNVLHSSLNRRRSDMGEAGGRVRRPRRGQRSDPGVQ